MSRNTAFPRQRLHLTVRGPGGPFEREDHSWVRDCRRAGWSLKLIASYFVPQPSSAMLRRVLGEKKR